MRADSVATTALEVNHYCAGCGRCMTDGCDGRWTLHTGDCTLLFCLTCDGETQFTGDDTQCLCAEPQTARQFCDRCASLLTDGSCSRCH